MQNLTSDHLLSITGITRSIVVLKALGKVHNALTFRKKAPFRFITESTGTKAEEALGKDVLLDSTPLLFITKALLFAIKLLCSRQIYSRVYRVSNYVMLFVTRPGRENIFKLHNRSV